MVAEDAGDDADGLGAVLGRDEAERLCQPCGGIALVVGHAEPAADEQVEPAQPPRSVMPSSPTSWA